MAALRESEALACAIPHELRAPLMAVDGFARALAEADSNAISARGRHYLERILAATTRMDGLIKAMLTLGPLSTMQLRTERVDLAAVAMSVVHEFRLGESQRVAEVSIEPDLVVNGDAELLRQLLHNLLGNAWKFTRERDLTRISFSATSTPDGRVYRVQDNGVGFDMREASDLFTPFSRLSSHYEFGGNGIGLAIARRIAERHAGRIWADASPSAGASFFFMLASREYLV